MAEATHLWQYINHGQMCSRISRSCFSSKIIHKHKLHPKATYCNGNFLTNQMKHHCYTETPDQFQTIRKTSGYSVDWTVDGHDHGFSDGYYGGRAAAFSRRSEPNCGKKWGIKLVAITALSPESVLFSFSGTSFVLEYYFSSNPS